MKTKKFWIVLSFITFSVTGCPPPTQQAVVAPPPVVSEAPALVPAPAMSSMEKMIRLADISGFGTNSITLFLPKEDNALFINKNTVIPSHIVIQTNDTSISIIGSGVDVAKVYKQLYNVGPEGGEGH